MSVFHHDKAKPDRNDRACLDGLSVRSLFDFDGGVGRVLRPGGSSVGVGLLAADAEVVLLARCQSGDRLGGRGSGLDLFSFLPVLAIQGVLHFIAVAGFLGPGECCLSLCR